MSNRIRAAVAMLAVVSAVVAAQTPAGRFQYERIVDAPGGPQRLDVDVALLAGAKPFTVEASGTRWVARRGLGDVRLFDSNDVEVPYLLIEPSSDSPAFGSFRTMPIPAIDKPDEKSSGFEVDAMSVRTLDAILLNTFSPPYLKRFRLEGSGDRERWTELVRDGTTFRLPAERLEHLLIEFEPGEYRYLRVIFDDTNSARLPNPDGVEVRMPQPRSVGPVLRSDVEISRRPSEPGRSRYRLTLPGPRLPIVALELKVSGGNVSREARVLETGLVNEGGAAPRLLGGGPLTRVVRDFVIAESMRLQIRQPTEPELELVVEDGDNPPLQLEAVTAIYAEAPWIYFESAPGPITVRYGDAKLYPPRYDLEAARAHMPSRIDRAVWRSTPAVTLEAADEGLAMPNTGSAIATEGFEYVREIPEGDAGLIALQLDLAAMAHSGRDPRRLRDVRVVDSSGLQIPYLLESRDAPLITEVGLERKALPEGLQASSPRVSTYKINLPFQNLPKPRLVLTTRARVFQRTVTLASVAPGRERQPARLVQRGTVTWTHADQDTAAPPVRFDLPDSSLDQDLYLLIDEGDNQPLPIDRTTLLVPQYAIRLFRRDNQALRLLYGRDDLAAPRYDLALLSQQVLGRSAEDVSPGPEQPLGANGAAAASELVPPAVFWTALVVTVIVLLGFVVRLMRKEA